ncbi:MAG: hypothetical protein GXP25_12725 [Planctomycetes bacterium]|nr:hypothetical protein [Planctomycetota bacterium]
MTEVQVTFDSGANRLLGMLHVPDGEVKAGIVFCNAFGEERKCSHRALVLLARAMARRGYGVLRFDYAGCGDSAGELRDATITSIESDIQTAIDFANTKLSPPAMGLLGLRLGGALAGRVAGNVGGIDRLILLQPIPKGETAFASDLKRKRIREMMMKGKNEGKRADIMKQLESGEGEVDLDGFVITGAFYRGLLGVDLNEQVGSFSGRVLIVQAAPNDAIRPEMEALREAYGKAGAAAAVVPLVLQPFWSRIDFVECDDLIAHVCAWLEG